jgi:hypothetical protein
MGGDTYTRGLVNEERVQMLLDSSSRSRSQGASMNEKSMKSSAVKASSATKEGWV